MSFLFTVTSNYCRYLKCQFKILLKKGSDGGFCSGYYLLAQYHAGKEPKASFNTSFIYVLYTIASSRILSAFS